MVNCKWVYIGRGKENTQYFGEKIMANPAIDKPSYWNIDWYREQKEKGMHDAAIADHLCISISVFYMWKRQTGIPKFAYTFSNAKGRN